MANALGEMGLCQKTKERGTIMRLGSAAIGNIARMICGDAPFSYVPYRSSSSLTAFFEGLNLDYVHDGSTRYWWVKSVLDELNQKPSTNEVLPTEDIIRVIEYLLHPDHFVTKENVDRNKAINQMNEILKTYELEVAENPKTGIVKLRTMSGDFVSSAVEEAKSEKRITFTPSVFKIPERGPLENLVSVMMPFAAEFNSVYDTIKQTCEDNQLLCYRADDLWNNSTFIQDIFDLIFSSHIVIVDFTGRNPNVMYETGIAHTLGKIVIPITQSIDDIPSDLKPHRALKYLSNHEGLNDLSDQLGKRIRTIYDGHTW